MKVIHMEKNDSALPMQWRVMNLRDFQDIEDWSLETV